MDCIGCGPTTSRPSGEHIFSKWLLKEFDPNASMPLLRQHRDGSQQQVRVEIKLDSFRLKDVCETCNNGWMSKLEEDAKPIILDLIRNQRDLSNLNAEERGILAAWAGKTAVIESRAVGAECPIDGDYLQQIRRRDGRPPATFAVAACRSGKGGFAHMQVGVIRDLIGGGKASGNIILIAIPTLAFACAFPMLPIPFRPMCVKSLYVPLWPDPSRWRDIDQTPMPAGLQGLEHVSALAERVELFQSVV